MHGIWGIPVRLENLLKLRNNGRVISTKAHTCRVVEVIPHKIARPNMSSDITNRVLSMVDPGKTRVSISSLLSVADGRPRRVETRDKVVFDLHFSRALVVLGRRAENVRVEEGFQVLIRVVYGM